MIPGQTLNTKMGCSDAYLLKTSSRLAKSSLAFPDTFHEVNLANGLKDETNMTPCEVISAATKKRPYYGGSLEVQ
jgi:hypothetical protein